MRRDYIMIPSPIYCTRCGHFIGEHRMTKTGDTCKGLHTHLEDCVNNLHKDIKIIREELYERNNATV